MASAETQFDDFTQQEPDLLDHDIKLEFLAKLESSEVKPGVTKWIVKVPKDRALVEKKSRTKISKLHWTSEGLFEKKNNNNYKMLQNIKLGGESDLEMVECVRTMCPGEISYFRIDRAALDTASEPIDESLLSDAEKKKITSGKLLDGYYRIVLEEEVKVKENVKGESESLESRIQDIAGCKAKGNKLFCDSQSFDACKEYMRGFNLTTCFPKKQAEEQNKPHILEELKNLRRDLINNGLKASYKSGNYKTCERLFDQAIIQEMSGDPKFAESLSHIWVKTAEDDKLQPDVSGPIAYCEHILESKTLPNDVREVISANLKKLQKYEKSYSVFNGLRTYEQNAEEFDRETMIAEKIREQFEKQEQASTQEASNDNQDKPKVTTEESAINV